MKGGTQNIDLTTILTDQHTLTIFEDAVLTGTNNNLQIILKDEANVTLNGVDLGYTDGGPVIRIVEGANYT